MVHHKKITIFSCALQSRASVMYEENIFCTQLLLINSALSGKKKMEEVIRKRKQRSQNQYLKYDFYYLHLGRHYSDHPHCFKHYRYGDSFAIVRATMFPFFFCMSYISSLKILSEPFFYKGRESLIHSIFYFLSGKVRATLLVLYLPEKLSKICS